MKPPDCATCGKRFDPFRSFLGRRGGTVRFADHKPLPDGMTGHPAGTEWFCRRHIRAAKALRNRSLSDALAALRGQRWRRLARCWGLVALLLLVPVAWNLIGPVELGDVGDRYVGRFTEGRLQSMSLDGDGARLAARWIENRTRPSRNPLRILWQQLWYNTWTEGHELELWIEPAGGSLDMRRYALYQSGRTVFLRLEFDGKNRVLDAAFSAAELELALEPHLVGAGEQLNPEAF